MNHYITGNTIRTLREQRKLTQAQLGEILGVSHKTISKWETMRGLPDITLIEPLAKALNISVMELLSGEQIVNQNRASNMSRSKLYVCPICCNTIHSSGDALISCCGITLPALEAEDCDEEHCFHFETVEDETFITLPHPMEKEHYISFLAFASGDKFQLVKLYAEGSCEARMKLQGHGFLYAYCNKHGLYKQRL